MIASPDTMGSERVLLDVFSMAPGANVRLVLDKNVALGVLNVTPMIVPAPLVRGLMV